MTWTVVKLVNWTTDYFKKRGISSARLDAELLLADTLGFTRVQLYTRFDHPLSAEELAEFKARVSRRAAREPVAYILGRKEFWGIDFSVGPGVLIPRPDTERLVEEAIKLIGARPRQLARKILPWNLEAEALAKAPQPVGAESASKADRLEAEAQIALPVIQLSPVDIDGPAATADPGALATQPDRDAQNAPLEVTPASAVIEAGTATEVGTVAEVGMKNRGEPALVLDLCTGSANIPICIARETEARVVATDVSPEALEFARRNVEAHVPAGRVALLLGDLTATVPARFHGRFDLLTANPPYIAATELETLQPEVSQFEPRLALSPGEDDLTFYRRIAEEVPRMVRPGGWVLLEVGTAAQGEAVMALLAEQGVIDLELLRDLARQVRVVKGRRAGQ